LVQFAQTPHFFAVSIKSAQDQKRKTLFEEMEKKLKEQMKKK
jgi:hypothetical protein